MSVPKLDKANNGYWYAVWSDAGRSKRKSMGAQDSAVAKERFAQWLLLGGENPLAAPLKTCTVADAWAFYEDRHIRRHVAAPETLAFNWKNLAPHFGPLPIEAVNQDAIDGYVEKRTSGRLGRAVKPQTCRKEISALLACLNFCSTPPNVLFGAELVQRVKLPEAGEPRDRWLTADEMKRLFDHLRETRGARLSRVERFCWLALETAAREQAILDLTWDRVDFEAGVIHYDVPGRRKTKKKRAAVPISRALRPILERAHAERTGPLVLDNKGAVWALVQHAVIGAGLAPPQKIERSAKPRATGISPHVFRHTAATHMARRGVSLYAIAKVLGNTYQVVEKTYAKWSPDDPAGTVDKISNGVLEGAN